ncbi:Nup84 protein [Saccharomycopsis crataegensis]|uniref:Nuclear pore complex protein n=1 Tax=Saccharomycopsis crataegensis TaxID=43959 RepID=A0AAV5QRX7_9ASCO|nr:Nup84 protein [Saccharomycopsis crataegensis]
MALIPTNVKSIDEEFGESLYSQLLSHDQSIGLPQIFARITSLFDVKLLQQESLNKSFNLETKLWDLAGSLMETRMDNYEDSAMDISQSLSKKFNSNYSFLDNFMDNNKELQEIWTIINWIKRNLMNLELDQAPKDSNKWLNTKLALQENNISKFYASQSNSKPWMVNKLDYDAIIRQNKLIDPKDMENDLSFFKKLYFLVLTSNHVGALELCEETNNWTHYMILQGLTQYSDPVVDEDADTDDVPQGIKEKYLWRRNCFKLSQYSKSDNEYEKCLFEYLSGGIEKNLQLNRDDWETSLLVYLNGFLTKTLENYLIDIQKVDDPQPLSVPELSNIKSINDILLDLSMLPGLKEASENSLRKLMGSLMLGNVASTISSFLNQEWNSKVLNATTSGDIYSDLDDDITDLTDYSQITYSDQDGDYEESAEELEGILATDPHYDNQNTYLLRVLVHLAIYLRFINDFSSVTDENLTALIKLYLKRTFKKCNYRLIPVYMKLLPVFNEEQSIEFRKIYSYYLSKLIKRENRIEQIKACQHLELIGLREILIDTVNIIINKYNNYYMSFVNNIKKKSGSVMVNDDVVTDIDKIYYTSIEWLLEYSNMNHVAIAYIVQIFTNFLLSGKIRSMIEFYKSYNFSEIIKQADVEVEIFNAKLGNGSDTESNNDNSDTDDIKIALSDADVRFSEVYQTNRTHLFNFLKLIKEGFINVYGYEEYLIGNNLNPAKVNLYNNIELAKWRNQIVKDELNKLYFSPLKTLIRENLMNLTISADLETNELFKSLYVPYFIISFHKMLVNSRFCDFPGASGDILNKIGKESGNFLKQAINMSTMVASSRYNFTKYFQRTNRLKEYLKLIAECSALAGESVIYN